VPTIIAQPSLILPKFLAADSHLSANAKFLLTLLDDYSERDTGYCNPRIAQLAVNLSVSRRTIQRALTQLQQRKLILIWGSRQDIECIITPRDHWLELLSNESPKEVSL
jgi:DNA-binding transcriptional regulator YhcF (GntR family)